MSEDHPFTLVGADRPSQFICLCDHATNRVPQAVNGGTLGLPAQDMERHIAYDIGAAGVTHALAEALDGPAVLSNFSRLVIDPNRAEQDPTALMRLYDGTLIPSNRHADPSEKQCRIEAYHRPYHDAIANTVASRKDPILISVHSFTPQLKGRPMRPWQIGVLYADDTRLAHPLLAQLQEQPDLCVGDNQPYTGRLPGDTMDRHALRHGHLHVLIELRNDLISTEDTQKHWGARLAETLTKTKTIASL